jgi:signal transduction histidine kinase
LLTTIAADAVDRRSRMPQVLAVVGVAGIGACAATVWAVSRSPILLEPRSTAVVRGLYVALTICVGAYVWSRRPQARFGPLLVVLGFLYALTSLNASGGPVPHTLGMVVWAAQAVFLAYVYLTFPQGRLATSLERAFIAVSIAANVVVWGLIIALSHRVPKGGVFSDCGGNCPENAFRFFAPRDGVGDALIVAFNATLTLLGFGLALLFVAKARSPTHLRRRAVEPLGAVFIATIVQLLLFIYLSPAYPGTKGAFRIINAVLLLSVPVAVIVGQVWGTASATRTVRRVVAKATGDPVSPARVQELLREALGDPTLDFALWSVDAGAYVGVSGRSIELPSYSAGRAVTPISRADRPLAALIHNSGLDHTTELVAGLTATSLMLLENATLVEELRASRARIVSTAEQERLRLERDLHDGAQQRLMAIQIKLGLAREDADGDVLAAKLDEIAEDARAAVEELRVLAHGIYPTVLRERGLADALRSVAAKAPIRLDVVDPDVGRLPPEIEAALYFCAMEAVQNMVKHAGADARATLTVTRRSSGVAVEIADDGVGFDSGREGRRGLGLVSMRDRIGAVGGELEVVSTPGGGTSVRAFVPEVGPIRTVADDAGVEGS